MKKVLIKLWNYLTSTFGDSIMIVNINLPENTMECINWNGTKMFSAELDQNYWNNIKPYCRTGSWPYTRIYIWAGMKRKHIAYCLPIEPYLAIKNWTLKCFK